uniref:Uncharacterized protein n=1 Tax=Octopus bimaculoides TaxID=37653 RepID=A0A0L8FS39_OCTBM
MKLISTKQTRTPLIFLKKNKQQYLKDIFLLLFFKGCYCMKYIFYKGDTTRLIWYILQRNDETHLSFRVFPVKYLESL